MKKIFTLTALAAVAFAGAAFAADSTDIVKDKGAIAKDNMAIGKQDGNIAVNRAEKADAKAREDYVDQASQSTQIGANKTVKAYKNNIEKPIDKKILNHDEKNYDSSK